MTALQDKPESGEMFFLVFCFVFLFVISLFPPMISVSRRDLMQSGLFPGRTNHSA